MLQRLPLWQRLKWGCPNNVLLNMIAAVYSSRTAEYYGCAGWGSTRGSTAVAGLIRMEL